MVPRNNRRVYDMRKVLDIVIDDGEWFEVQPGSGKAIICGVDEMIDLRETRNVLLSSLSLARSRRQVGPEPGGRITP